MARFANPTVTLTAYNMGPETTEADYDAWCSFVCNRIDAAMGYTVDVDAVQWGREMPAEDAIDGATEEQAEAIRGWLAHEGWDAFCGERSEEAA